MIMRMTQPNRHNVMRFVAVLAWGWLMAGGCTYQRVVKDDLDTWRKLATKERTPDQLSMPQFSQASASGWTVELSTFTGKRRFAQAYRLVSYLKENTPIADAWVYDVGSHVAVYRGRFGSADDSQAQELLHQTRELAIESTKRFEKAQLVPFGQAAKGAATPSDLAQFAGMDGYTLQVAVFDAAGGGRYREAAETYCRQLREKDEQAYFFHGPNRSMVTVGLFDESDLVAEGPIKRYGPRIRDTQSRFPHNLVNGSTVVERAGDQIMGEQSSTLVRLPR